MPGGAPVSATAASVSPKPPAPVPRRSSGPGVPHSPMKSGTHSCTASAGKYFSFTDHSPIPDLFQPSPAPAAQSKPLSPAPLCLAWSRHGLCAAARLPLPARYRVPGETAPQTSIPGTGIRAPHSLTRAQHQSAPTEPQSVHSSGTLTRFQYRCTPNRPHPRFLPEPEYTKSPALSRGKQPAKNASADRRSGNSPLHLPSRCGTLSLWGVSPGRTPHSKNIFSPPQISRLFS